MSTYLENYSAHVQRMRQSTYMNWPSHVHLETYAKCNASCHFCPYPSIARKDERMSDELIEKIIRDLTDIPKSHRFQLSPFKVNEPFLDNRLFDILHTINEKLPNASITLTTNATPLTAEKIIKLRDVQNFRQLWISFNDHRQAQYEEVMHLPFGRTIERLDMLHASVMRYEIPFEVVLSRVSDNSSVDSEFGTWVKQNYPGFKTGLLPRGGWIGQVDTPQLTPVPNVACYRWFDVSITATGIVAFCCMDGQAASPIGDVRTQHVLDIYNAPQYRQLREATETRLAVSPCNQCTFL